MGQRDGKCRGRVNEMIKIKQIAARNVYTANDQIQKAQPSHIADS
jgi:hypothetical protein